MKHMRFSRIGTVYSQCCDEGDEVLDKIADKQSLLVCCVKHWTIEWSQLYQTLASVVEHLLLISDGSVLRILTVTIIVVLYMYHVYHIWPFKCWAQIDARSTHFYKTTFVLQWLGMVEQLKRLVQASGKWKIPGSDVRIFFLSWHLLGPILVLRNKCRGVYLVKYGTSTNI